MLKEIKTSIRIHHELLDDNIESDIETCKADLRMSGVYAKDSDVLLKKACELYCKWQYDYQGKGEQYEKSYRSLKDAMALCGDYNVRSTD